MSEQNPVVPNHKLRHERRKRFLTIKQAADKLNVSVSSFGRWERGTQRPHLTILRELCELFGATAEELGFGDLQD